VLGVGAGREGQTQDDRAPRRQTAHGCGILEQPRRHDRREPPAVGQGVEGGMQVVFQHLEGRVGDDRVEVAGRGQDVLQMPGVMGVRAAKGKNPSRIAPR
jgi:hypothetical protein